jgi:hypothetical protein
VHKSKFEKARPLVGPETLRSWFARTTFLIAPPAEFLQAILTMELPGIGKFKEDFLGRSQSAPISIPILGGKCRFLISDSDPDPEPSDYAAVIKNFLSLDKSVLKRAEPHIFEFYRDCNSDFDPDDDEFVEIDTPENIWKHIRFGKEAELQRRSEDNQIYISLGCECDWDPEHGLQIVFKNGLEINKVGECDGHLTNSDAFDRPEFENVVYVSRSKLPPD